METQQEEFNESTIPYHLEEVKRLCVDRGQEKKFVMNRWTEVFRLMLYNFLTNDGASGINAEFETLNVDKNGVKMLVHAKQGTSFSKEQLEEMKKKGVPNMQLQNMEQGELNTSPELEEGNRIYTEINFGRLLWYLKDKYGFDVKAEMLDEPDKDEAETDAMVGDIDERVRDTRTDLVGVYTAANSDAYVKAA